MKKVVIIKKVITHYRVGFYEMLAQALRRNNIDLLVLYGEYEKGDEFLKDDLPNRPWAEVINIRYFNIGKIRLVYQACLKSLKDADLIIIDQWNSLLINYYLMFRRLLRISKAKLAFWGHGSNRQAHPRSLQNVFKRIFIKQVDWWFAYTEGVKQIVKKCGFPEDKITMAQNAIDTVGLAAAQRAITDEERDKARIFLGLKNGSTAIFCGKMYKEKRIPFLIKACLEIKKRVSDFQMIFIGAGKFKKKILKLSKGENWVFCLPSIAGKEKLIYFSLADLLLMPGLVGLVVLDSFVTKTPIVTTNYEFHSPEVEYIENEVNGIITDNRLEAYVDEVTTLLKNKEKIEKLKKGYELSLKKYTIENMADNFVEGILKCLSSARA